MNDGRSRLALVRRLLFLALTLAHAAVVLIAPDAGAPFAAASLYLPLLPLHGLGLPVLATAESGGWSALSPLGWAVCVLWWGAVWWVTASWLSRRWRKPRPSV